MSRALSPLSTRVTTESCARIQKISFWHSDAVIQLRRDVDDMERLIDDFLTFARGDAMEKATQTDPVALVQGVVPKLRGQEGRLRLPPQTLLLIR